MDLNDYQFWLNLARKHSHIDDEAEDLLQDSLLIAVQAGKSDLTIETHRRWFSGVIKNRALMVARTEQRRKLREQKSNESDSSEDHDSSIDINKQVIEKFPHSSKKVIKLILAGLNQIEICTLLHISRDAFRQRLTAIRKSIKQLPKDLQSEAIAMAYYKRESRHDELAVGLIRKALVRALRDEGEIGSHDPDGHLIIFSQD